MALRLFLMRRGAEGPYWLWSKHMGRITQNLMALVAALGVSGLIFAVTLS